MLDFRYKTFLELCKIGNFTQTAKTLHITQPAVSQHIKYLESLHGFKLFYKEGKGVKLTDKGVILRDFAMTLNADVIYFNSTLLNDTNKKRKISFGATLSIGEYVMPQILSEMANNDSNLEFNMAVDNTKTLLNKLNNGEIQYALIEGYFNKSDYDWKLFSKEKFIGVCSHKSKLRNKKIDIKNLLNERIILREKGSGTRDVFEQILYENNLSINSFSSIWEIGNMNGIKDLVIDDLGITFLYEAAAKNEIKKGELCIIDSDILNVFRGFYFIYLKNSLHKNIYLSWFDILQKSKTN